ncbi:metallophosphoesterase [Roseibium sp.]|uniref:metallophosphoesterase n=1 Tax=Roseibium sp. TaxID=1936156 RepID=UPI0039EFFC20
MSTFFTADTHFGHGRIIELSQRPFGSVNEMQEVFIRNWNAVVTPDDVVWHLGDFGIDDIEPGKALDIFCRLNGTKHLILGNHDQEVTHSLPWESVSESKLLDTEEGQVFLCHYPMLTWPRARKGAIHLFGHLHSEWLGTDLSADVGVDAWDYRPVMFPEIRRRMKKQKPNEVFTKTKARM